MARETENGIQENNGAPMGQGQPGKKGFRAKAKQLKRKQSPPEVAGAINGNVGLTPEAMPAVPPVFADGQPRTFQDPRFSTDAGRMEMPQGPQVNTAQQLQPQKGLGGYQGTGTMLGFNTALDYDNESAKNSMKNQFGQIASRYKAAPSMLDAVMNDPDFKALFPNARKAQSSAGDQIDFGGQVDPHSGAAIGVVDVGGAFDPANDSGAGWTWQDLVNDAMGPAPGNAIYQQAQNQMGTEGGQQTMQMLESLDEGTLMELLRALMGEGQQEIF